MIHVTRDTRDTRAELSEQVTTATMLMCKTNNETIKICISCKKNLQYSVYRLEKTAIFVMSRRS